MKQIVIIGKRIRLEEIGENHLPILLPWRNNSTFIQNCLSMNNTCSIEQLKSEISRAYLVDRYAHFVAYNNSAPIGTTWIYKYNSFHGYAYLTIFITEHTRNRNYYGVEIFTLICNYIFNTMGCRKVYCEVHANNLVSKSILENAGLFIEGQLLNHNRISDTKYCDLLIFALYKKQFLTDKIAKKFL